MAFKDLIRIARGLKADVNKLRPYEIGYVTDEADGELYIGTPEGPSKVTRNKEVEEISTSLAEIGNIEELNTNEKSSIHYPYCEFQCPRDSPHRHTQGRPCLFQCGG